MAAAKIEKLLAARAAVGVVAPRVSSRVEWLAAASSDITLARREFRPADLNGASVVIAATNDREMNASVATAARERHILANVVDDPAHCDFIFPAIVDRGPVQIAISTGGRSPALARHLRERLESIIGPEYAEVAELLAEVRAKLRAANLRPSPEAWQAVLDETLFEMVRLRDLPAARGAIRERLLTAAGSAAR